MRREYHRSSVGLRPILGFFLAAVLWAQTPFMPLAEVRPGMKGTGRTVFSGDRIEEFQVEVLGVLENVGPQQSVILVKLSGGPLAQTGILQGMSGSPIYLGGKLAGAVAMSFQYSKEPVAGVRPIEEMLRDAREAPPAAPRRAWSPPPEDLLPAVARRAEIPAAGGKLMDIATPVSFSGFTRGAIEHFAGQLRALGLEPAQGMAGGGSKSSAPGDPSRLKPGSMISVQLMRGDLAIGADGTVTHIEGKRVYAFGHRFLSIGATELPFARAEVLTLLPNIASSFKISAAREWMGSMLVDRSTVVAGEIGRRAAMTPVNIRLTRHGSQPATRQYKIEMASDRALAPFLFQMAVYSAIDATERGLGPASIAVNGRIDFGKSAPPVRMRNLYAGDYALNAQVSLATAVPLFYALQSGFDALKPTAITLDIDCYPEKRQGQIGQVWASRATARPGETIELTVALMRDNGAETLHKARYTVPVGATAGPLYFTVADGTTTNWLEYRGLLTSQPRSLEQLISFLNGLRENTKAYVRVWRSEPSFQVQGEELPNPPASVAMILGKAQASLGGAAARNAKLAEIPIDAAGYAVTGSKTIQVEIKE